MRHAVTTLVTRENTAIVQDALGALSLCICGLVLLYLPGLF